MYTKYVRLHENRETSSCKPSESKKVSEERRGTEVKIRDLLYVAGLAIKSYIVCWLCEQQNSETVGFVYKSRSPAVSQCHVLLWFSRCNQNTGRRDEWMRMGVGGYKSEDMPTSTVKEKRVTTTLGHQGHPILTTPEGWKQLQSWRTGCLSISLEEGFKDLGPIEAECRNTKLLIDLATG